MRFLLLLWLVSSALAPVNAASRPNVIVIVVDDLGWASVGYHNKSVATPNLDQMAREGTQLDRFYVYPVCSPTRAALLTGQMPRRFQILSALNGMDPGLPAGATTMATTLKAAGYQTSLIGKWHLGKASTPQGSGFEHFYGFINSEVDYYTHTNKGGMKLDWQRDGKAVREEGYSTYLFADEAVQQLKSRDRARPFYLQVTFNAPHVPLSAPPELIEKHKAKGTQAGLYAAVVEAMDLGIGRILGALDAEKLRQDTLVIFFSDNGAARRDGGDNTPLRAGKGTVYEGGIHTPALIRWPGKIPAGVVSTQPISVQDVFPTVCAALGVAPAKEPLDGSSQWAALQQGKRLDRKPFLIASFDTALLDGDWKLYESDDGLRSLYNLKDDLSELTDLVTKQPEQLTRLGKIMDELKKSLPPITVKRESVVGPGGGGAAKGGPGKGGTVKGGAAKGGAGAGPAGKGVRTPPGAATPAVKPSAPIEISQ